MAASGVPYGTFSAPKIFPFYLLRSVLMRAMLIVVIAAVGTCRNRSTQGIQTMESKPVTLKTVSAILGIKPYRINYVYAVKLVPEPKRRFGNKRVFTEQDIQRLREYFRGTPEPSTT
jgi:hypothetical protein